MSVYTTQLWYVYRNSFGPLVGHTIFTVPNDGNTYVLRDFLMRTVPADSTVSAQVLLYPSGSAPGPVTLADTGVLPFGVSLVHWEGRQELPAGSILQLFVDGDSFATIDTVGTGYRLTP